MYSMLELDHGLKKTRFGGMGGGCSLLTELCRIVRGTGFWGETGRHASFFKRSLTRCSQQWQRREKKFLSSTHAKSHMGENNVIQHDLGGWFIGGRPLWKECKKTHLLL